MDFLFHVPFFCTARPNIISRVSKLPDSTWRKQAILNKGSLFYSHCGPGVVYVTPDNFSRDMNSVLVEFTYCTNVHMIIIVTVFGVFV
jgi:hypothetical protein